METKSPETMAINHLRKLSGDLLKVCVFQMRNQPAKPVEGRVAARPTGMKRPHVRFTYDGMLALLATGLGQYNRSWPQATPVFGRQRSCHPVSPQGAFLVQSRCNKCKTTIIFAFKQVSAVWICPLNRGKSRGKNVVV